MPLSLAFTVSCLPLSTTLELSLSLEISCILKLKHYHTHTHMAVGSVTRQKAKANTICRTGRRWYS